jgi:hypothetical protein
MVLLCKAPIYSWGEGQGGLMKTLDVFAEIGLGERR